MTTPELNQFIAKEFAKGSDQISFYELEKYQRTAMPFAAYILTLIGVGIAGRKIRGGIGLQILVGIVLTAIYFFSMKMSTVASTNAGLPPIYGVWIPNIIFSFVAIYLSKKIRGFFYSA